MTHRNASATGQLRMELDDLAHEISAPYVPAQEETFETLSNQGHLARLRGHSPLEKWAPTLLHLCYWETDASDWAASELTRQAHDSWTEVLLRTCACRGGQGRPDELLDALTAAISTDRNALKSAATAATMLWSAWVLSEQGSDTTVEDLAGILRNKTAMRIYGLIRRAGNQPGSEWRGLPSRARIPLWLLTHDSLIPPQQLLHEPQNDPLLRQRLVRPDISASDRELVSTRPSALSWLLPTLNLRAGTYGGPLIQAIINSWSPNGMPEPDLEDGMTTLRRHLACVPSPAYLLTENRAQAVNHIEASCWINLALSLVRNNPMKSLPQIKKAPSRETREHLRETIGRQINQHNLGALVLAQELTCIFINHIGLSSVCVEEGSRDQWKAAFRQAVTLLEYWIGCADEERHKRVQRALEAG